MSKVMISIDHPAWAHQFRHIIKMLNERGDEVRTLAIEKDGDTIKIGGVSYTKQK